MRSFASSAHQTLLTSQQYAEQNRKMLTHDKQHIPPTGLVGDQPLQDLSAYRIARIPIRSIVIHSKIIIIQKPDDGCPPPR
jgi:hypothetical protein